MKNLKSLIIIAMIVCLGIVFTSCSEDLNTEGSWTLTSITANGVEMAVADGTLPGTISMFLEKDAADEDGYVISGFAGVNSFMGSVNIAKSTITVSPLGVTKMLGSKALQNVEDIFLVALQEGGTVSIKEDGDQVLLGFESAEKKTYLEFKKTLLENTAWNLVMYNMGYAITNIPAIVETVTIGFSEDGKVHGTTGTNQITGTYECSSDESIAFGPLATTRMAAVNEEAFHFETRLMELYAQVTTFSISGSKLTFLNDKGEVLLVFEKK